jgi:hypothetical protein
VTSATCAHARGARCWLVCSGINRKGGEPCGQTPPLSRSATKFQHRAGWVHCCQQCVSGVGTPDGSYRVPLVGHGRRWVRPPWRRRRRRGPGGWVVCRAGLVHVECRATGVEHVVRAAKGGALVTANRQRRRMVCVGGHRGVLQLQPGLQRCTRPRPCGSPGGPGGEPADVG